MRRPRFEVVRTPAGWHVNYYASNGECVLTGEPVTSRAAAETAVASVKRGAAIARVTGPVRPD